MSLLELIFGKRPKFAERIWPTTARKIDDLVSQVQSSHKRSVYPITVVHFRATQMLLIDAFKKKGVEAHAVLSATQFPAEITEDDFERATTLILPSEFIPSPGTRTAPPQIKGSHQTPVSIHMAEHYPTLLRDQCVLGLSKIWPMPLEFTCYTGLDEPWLTRVNGDRLRDLVKRMTVDDDTLLTHPFLSRSLLAVQKQIARKVQTERSCDSCSAWVRENL